MKLINYKCDECEREQEHLYMDTEEIPLMIPCRCAGDMKRWNVKNNGQRAFVFDQQKGGEE